MRAVLPLAALTLLGSAPAFAAAPDAGGPPAGALPDAGQVDASAADAGACPDPAVLSEAAEADLRLRQDGTCLAEDLEKLTAAVRALEACAGKVKPAKQWVFPVANVTPGEAIGGEGGSGFVRNPGIRCYATPTAGHPAHDLFVDDPHQKSRDKAGDSFPALAVEEAWVLVARDGWQPGDAGRGGNYLMLYLPARKQITYYAHLETVLVKPGERLEAGQVVGTIGRTGKNALPARSQTHLHFGLWDAASFRPVNSYPLLRAARTLKVQAPSE